MSVVTFLNANIKSPLVYAAALVVKNAITAGVVAFAYPNPI